jgi:glutathione S-transferase
MPLILFTHPFASYCQKVLIALYENETPFTQRILEQSDPSTFAEFEALWPLKKFPLLLDGDKAIVEATIIIEYLDMYHPGPARMIPADPKSALEVRFIDRFFDNYVHTPMQAVVADALRETNARDPKGVADAKAGLDVAYSWLERHLTDREWAAGGRFSLADCAAAPALFYADWVHQISGDFPNVRAYRNRLNARPSFARAIDEARPYRSLFPLGAPDRD